MDGICALKVIIQDESGKPYQALPDLPVTIIRSDRTVLSAIKARAGVVEICDIAFDVVSVVVGDSSRRKIEVSDIKMVWGKMLEVRVLYPPIRLADEESEIPYAGCRIHLRIEAPGGGAIGGAKVEFRNDKRQAERITDRFGRQEWATPLGRSTQIIVKAEGFRAGGAVVQCNRPEVKEITLRLENP